MAKFLQLKQIKLARGLEDRLANMIIARNDFYNCLKGLKVITMKNQKAARVGFTRDEAVKTPNLFFVEVVDM